LIDEAGMIGSRQLERVLGEAGRRGTKIVLVGDPEQLQAIEAGAAFRSITERHTHIEITEIRRQRERWQRKATRELSTGRAGEALDAYRDHGMVHGAESRDQARADLVEGWNRNRAETPEKSRIILTHTNDEVRALNDLARGKLREAGELGENVPIHVERGKREFASGDRVMFLKNDRGLGIKNGRDRNAARSRLRVRWLIPWFPIGPQSGSHHAHVSASLPAIPSSGVSPTRF
jgi:ATP-dependent exoDNAse (exonuclease V) alpha subunit